MAMHPFHRTELLVGGLGYQRLQSARICVIGLGGVGSYAVEALARSGVGHLTLVDFDRVCITNLNRQLHATRDTVNGIKSDLMVDRVKAINPKVDVRGIAKFFGEDSAEEILSPGFDYVLDCIDNMTAKVHLLDSCIKRTLPVVSAMGAGGRMDPTRVRVSDISKTNVDPFARLVRDLLRQKGIKKGIECVWSEESPNALDSQAKGAFRCICPGKDDNEVHGCESRHQVQGSVSWMPSLFGLTMAGVAINRLLERPIHGVDSTPDHRRMAPSFEKPSLERKRQLMKEAGVSRS